MDTNHHIREREAYDYMEDPSYVEEQIIDRMEYCADEMLTIQTVTKTMIQQALLRWGIMVEQSNIVLDIRVTEAEEAITWIDHERQPVNYNAIAQHARGSAMTFSHSNQNHTVGMHIHSPGMQMTIRPKQEN